MSLWPIKILHLGLGRFHRAHQAVYYQELAEKFGDQWGVAAFSMRTSEARDQMLMVNCQYPVIQFSKNSTELQWIKAIQKVYFAKEDKAKLMQYFASADIQLLTLTVTEKAYQSQDLISLIFEGLKARKEKINKGLTILSCDNLQGNGNLLKKSIENYAKEKQDPETQSWIEQQVSFPNSMVDRIVPALSEEKIQDLQKQFGIDNPEILATESFKQWVIEDNFKADRPPLDKVGAQFVKDVRPFEKIKLRLLNASHSFLAYEGLKKNYQFVHQAIRDPQIKKDVLELYAEVIPSLELPKNFDIEKYTKNIIERFDNEKLPHQLKQIAMDGSQKLMQRIFPSLELTIKNKGKNKILWQTVDRWIEHCYETTPDDPLQGKILALKQSKSFAEFKKSLLLEILDKTEFKNILGN